MRLFKRKSKQAIHVGIDPIWKAVCEKAESHYENLNKKERIWFNTRVLIDSFNNGGLISYYYNSGADNVYDAIDDLKSIELENVANLIIQHNDILFKGNAVPNDLEERSKYIETLDYETDHILNKIEAKFQDSIDEMEQELERFLKRIN